MKTRSRHLRPSPDTRTLRIPFIKTKSFGKVSFPLQTKLDGTHYFIKFVTPRLLLLLNCSQNPSFQVRLFQNPPTHSSMEPVTNHPQAILIMVGFVSCMVVVGWLVGWLVQRFFHESQKSVQ